MRGILTATLLTVGLVVAPLAHADADQDYLNTLSGLPGFTVNPFTSGFLLNAGHTICGDLANGSTVQDESAKMAATYPGATNYGASQMVLAAQKNLCVS